MDANAEGIEVFSESYEHSGAKRRGINSVEQGIVVLQAVVELRQPSSLKDIARLAGMDSSQAHRYVSSLVNCGMLRQDHATTFYDLGPTALRAGLAALSRQDSVALIEQGARDLSRRSGATLLFAVWAVGGAMIIRWYHGSPPVYTMLTVGSVLPLASSATGRVFRSFLDEALLADQLTREGQGPAEELAFAAEREQIRTRHVASVDNSVIPGLRATSCPVFGAGDRLIGALTVLATDAMPRSADAKDRK